MNGDGDGDDNDNGDDDDDDDDDGDDDDDDDLGEAVEFFCVIYRCHSDYHKSSMD